MNKRFIHPVTLLFLLTLAAALMSWVGSIYRWRTESAQCRRYAVAAA